MHNRIAWIVMGITLALVMTLGCSVTGLIGRPLPTPTPTRTPRPTFTPTPVTPELTEMQPVVQVNPQPEQPSPTPESPTPTPTSESASPAPTATPFVVVNEDVVNLRAGPGTNYPAVGKAQAGQRFAVTGKNPQGDWWQICCVGDQLVWVSGQVVRAEGAIDTVNVPERIPPPPPTPRPRPTQPPAPPAPTPTPALQYAFNATMVEARPNTNDWITVWGRVFNRNKTQAFGGYKVRVLRGGMVVGEGITSSAISVAYGGLDSQFIYNAKIEIRPPSDGQYTVQLLDPSGQPAGPDQIFSVSGTTREFLVEWLRP
ncbi:MAG: SH3 domain-containing protein [Anaerolineae bacterium]|nr:SH3 domain-containing protein [Anaerolineae bacterium]MDW8099871.1 SH3 domain-containing protein [Anaerolineae bacterium]